MNTLWTHAELEIVETLTRRVCLMSASQLADVDWSGIESVQPLELPLNRLLAAELLLRTVVNVQPRLTLDKPLVAWQPGANQPDLQRARAAIKERWQQSAEPTEVYWASRRAANLFGSTARDLPDLFHRDHDLLLSEVYVLYRRHRREWAQRWLGENVFPKAGFRTKDPDAFLFGDDGRPALVIESSGRYGLRQLESFHEHCVAFELPYEIW